jgi:putative phosphoesterase
MIHPDLLPADLTADHIRACVGLISDTHLPQRLAALPPAIFDVFAGADLILHAGDIGELRLLDQLSRCAPVVAVHGNDESAEAKRELPYQQFVAVAGQRILLWHSHFPDRIDEMLSRDEPLPPKLLRSVQRAQRAGARIAVFGHWHIPLVYEHDGVTVINPGGIASGNSISRQLQQTVALLFLLTDGEHRVRHVDLAQPRRSFVVEFDAEAGFAAAMRPYSASMLAPELAAHLPQLYHIAETIGYEWSLPPLLRVAHRCWAGEQELITLADMLREIEIDPDLPVRIKERYHTLLATMVSPAG